MQKDACGKCRWWLFVLLCDYGKFCIKKSVCFFLVKAEKLRSRLKKWMQISMLPVRTRAFVPLGRLFFNS